MKTENMGVNEGNGHHRTSAKHEGEDLVMLTETLIMAGASVKKQWNHKQLACLGVFPPNHGGWKRRLQGTYISRARYEMFLALRNAHLNLNPHPHTLH
jgi:hypothetical protein